MAESDSLPPAPVHSQDPVAMTIAFLRPWVDFVPQQQRRLGLFIFLALALHAAAFFFIRIDSSRAELPHLTRIHVAIESPVAPAAATPSGDEFWDRLNDPRLFLLPLTPSRSEIAGQAAFDALPVVSNLSSGTLPAPAPAQEFRFSQAAAEPLGMRAKEAMMPPRQRFHYDVIPPAVATRTTWQCDSALAARTPAGLPDLPSPVSDTDLMPTQIQVALDARGAVQHALIEQSSGSGRLDLDQQALLAARKIRFAPSDQPGLQWGRVTVFWHYAAQPRVEVVPTPPTTQ